MSLFSFFDKRHLSQADDIDSIEWLINEIEGDES